MQEVKIVIEGATATGKSSIAHALQKLCVENGISVSVIGYEDDIPEGLSSTYADRIKSLSGKVTVIVETKQAKRVSLN